MIERYQKKKKEEAEKAEQLRRSALIDYNIMMGILENPEDSEDDNDE